MKILKILMTLCALLAAPYWAQAHFQLVIPSTEHITGRGDRSLSIDLIFGHPFEGDLMDMPAPESFGYVLDGNKVTLEDELEKQESDHPHWKAKVEIKRPGDYLFFLDPGAYWEEDDEGYIKIYTKVVVNAMGRQDGWEKEIGQPVEIVPLTRPYGFWTGNVFRGVVKKDGKPVPNCWVEVERYNQGKEWKLPNDLFMTQYVLTDENGVFSYGVPKSGWWGFVAWPGPSGKTLKSPDGTADAKIAEGCAFWIYATDDKD